MRILVTGGKGQLGLALQEVLPEQESVFLTKNELDITETEKVSQQINDVRPEIVIHTAAYTDVDNCEANPDLAYRVNVLGTKNIALACQKIKATCIFISSDYVFDGKKKTPYQEEDSPHPLSVYGKTKWEGEKIVQRIPHFLIVRTAWLFGQGENFVQKIIQLSQKRKELKVVNDQIGCPTYALDLAHALWKLILIYTGENQFPKNKKDIYHITNLGYCSWHDFAREIIKESRLQVKISPISSLEWRKIKPKSAPRPSYSVLDGQKIARLGIKMRPWQQALKEYLSTL